MLVNQLVLLLLANCGRRPQGSPSPMSRLIALVYPAKPASINGCENTHKKFMFFDVAISRSETKPSFFEMQSIKKTLPENCAYSLHISQVSRVPRYVLFALFSP